jgi:tryptophanyl-tRNA synthetase
VGELMRMTQFKAKRDEAQGTNAGLFEYPILMAADILLYKATHVPVGADQKQHLELARTLARRFNQRYGECFVVPDPLMPEAGARIMALDNPAEKMSKSSPRDDSRLNLLDPPDVLRRKIRSALTDSYQGVTYDPMDRPGLANLLALYAALSGDTMEGLASRFGGFGHEAFKRSLVDLVILHLAPIQRRYGEITRHADYVDRVLAEGAERAAAIAVPTLSQVTEAVGLLAPAPASAQAAEAADRTAGA